MKNPSAVDVAAATAAAGLAEPQPAPTAAATPNPAATAIALRPDLQAIAGWIAPGSHVLDLGCGDGALLAHLVQQKQCRGYGVEINDVEVLACARRGVDVVQRNIEDGLEMFRGGRFNVVVLSMAIQATRQTETVLRDMSAVAADGIVSFPNFGHWAHLWSLMRGRMPVTREMPYQWYDTPNLHLTTIRDFEHLLGKLDLEILDRIFLADGHRVRRLASYRATQAIYRFRRGQAGG